jgi:metallo-beta-lactamase family protein
MDSAYIQEKDLQRVNERRRRQNREELELLYGVDDVQKTLELMQPIQYNQPFFLNDGEVEASFTDTGHILGSAAIHLVIPDKGTFKHVTFTGDIGRPNDKILNSPQPFPQPDVIICESTYGDRLHGSASDMKQKLIDIITETCIEKKGKLLIPAFAVDRTQELIYALDQLSSQGLLPRIDVYIDSPLAVQATRVMKKNDEFFNPEILEYINKDGDAFAFPNLHYISDVNQSKALNSSNEPCIIISASGMAEAGRIKHHIANNITNPSTTILLVGYAGPETLAGALKRGDKTVKIFGDVLPVIAQVREMDSFSGHGDYNEMIDYLNFIKPERVEKVFLVHGDLPAQEAFRTRLTEVGFASIEIPKLYESFEV